MKTTTHRTALRSLAAAGVASLALTAGAALAQPRHPHPPPPEAFAACESQEEGTLCRFDAPRGAIEGTCRQPPRVERLVCVPDHPPPRGERPQGAR